MEATTDAREADAEKAKEQQDELKRQAERAQELMLEPFKNTITNIQDAFAGFFENVFSGGINSFSDLASEIKRIFIRLAAEIAALTFFRPAVGGILGTLGLSGTASALGLPGGAGGSAGGGGGLGGFSMPLPGFGGGFTAGLNSFGANYLGLANAPASGIGPTAPGFLGNTTLSGALAGAGAGYLGRNLAGSIFGSSGTGADVGGAIGGAAGFYFGGPIGAGVGSFLGSAFGGLFGGNKDYPFSKQPIRIGKDGVARLVNGVHTLDGGDGSATRQMAQVLIDQLNVAIKEGGYKFDKGFSFSVGSASGRSDRLGKGYFVGTRGTFADGAEFTGIQTPEQLLQQALGFALGKGTIDTAQQLQETNPALVAMAEQLKAGRNSITPVLDALRDQFKLLKENAKDLGLSFRQIRSENVMVLVEMRRDVMSQARSLVASARSSLGIDNLMKFQSGLPFGNLSPLSPTGKFDAAKALFDDTASAALGGDVSAIQRFPQIAQQVLGLGRDVYASGPQYQQLFTSVNSTLNQVIGQQQTLLDSITDNLVFSIEQTSAQQIAEIRRQTTVLNTTFKELSREIRTLRAA